MRARTVVSGRAFKFAARGARIYRSGVRWASARLRCIRYRRWDWWRGIRARPADVDEAADVGGGADAWHRLLFVLSTRQVSGLKCKSAECILGGVITRWVCQWSGDGLLGRHAAQGFHAHEMYPSKTWEMVRESCRQRDKSRKTIA